MVSINGLTINAEVQELTVERDLELTDIRSFVPLSRSYSGELSVQLKPGARKYLRSLLPKVVVDMTPALMAKFRSGPAGSIVRFYSEDEVKDIRIWRRDWKRCKLHGYVEKVTKR